MNFVPLLGRGESHGPEQWIFPNMRFTCNGRLTKWIFRGIPSGKNVPDECRVHLTTWRSDPLNSLFITRYARTSTTERNTARITVDESYFNYELARPAQVKPGDIVGVEMGFGCSPFRTPDNILSLNVTGIGSSMSSLSYSKPSSLSMFFIDSSVATEDELVPLIQVIIGKFVNNSDIELLSYMTLSTP